MIKLFKMSKPENYNQLNISEKYCYYYCLDDDDIDSFLSHLTKDEKTELHVEGKRLEEEEKAREIAERSAKLEANVEKMIKESKKTGKPIFPVYR